MKKNITLTSDNAPFVASIINKKNPEWGSKRFQYKAQKLTGKDYAHVFGSGSNSAVLFESEMDSWSVVSFNDPESYPVTSQIIEVMEKQGFDPLHNDQELFKVVKENFIPAESLAKLKSIINKYK